MKSDGVGERHLSTESFEQYLAASATALIKIDGDPIVYLYIDPQVPRLALRTPLTHHSLPDVSTYQHISVAQIHWSDSYWFEIRVDSDVIRAAYPIMCAIADRIQLDGSGFDSAVSGSLAEFREVFSRHTRLTFEAEIGLYGELLLLNHIMKHSAPLDAVQSWRGPDGEEHDFDLAGNDVEVKCTTAEERIHWINGGHQLQPTNGRPLWLLSLQLTGAGRDGKSLSDLVSDTRSALASNPAMGLFARKLSSVGWRDESSRLHTARFRLRSEPAIYSVDSNFPAITSQRLADAGFDIAPIMRIRYALNLGALSQAFDIPACLINIGIPA